MSQDNASFTFLHRIEEVELNIEDTLYIISRKNAKFAKNTKILWRTSPIRKRHGYGTVFFVWEMTAIL